MTTTATPRTRRVEGFYATVGAARQANGSLPLYACTRCGAYVVWATSGRTGRRYLAQAYLSASVHESYFYIARDCHTDEACATVAARRDAMIEDQRRRDRTAHWTGELRTAQAIADPTARKAAMLAVCERWEAEG